MKNFFRKLLKVLATVSTGIKLNSGWDNILARSPGDVDIFEAFGIWFTHKNDFPPSFGDIHVGPGSRHTASIEVCVLELSIELFVTWK